MTVSPPGSLGVVASETGVLTDVLLCRPDHYRWVPLNAVAMHSLAEGQADPRAVAAGYDELLAALADAGVACHFVEPQPHLPSQVYTRDSSQSTPWGPMLTQLRMPARRGEYASVLRFYEQAGAPMWQLADQGTIEGGDIAIIRPGLAMIGVTGVRTDTAGAEQLAGWMRAEGWEVRLVPFDEHFLHLDLLFCMATPGLAVVSTDVLDPDTQDWLRDHGIDLLPISYRQTMAMEGNLLALGDDRVISPKHCTAVNQALRAAGVTVLDPDLAVFAAGGGSVHCMTMPLRRTEP